MKKPFAIYFAALVAAGLLVGQESRAQSLFFDFNGSDTYTPNFFQGGNQAGSLLFGYSSTGGVNDNAGAPGGSVFLSPAGFIGGNVRVTLYNTPPSFSLNSGNAYSISNYTQITDVTTANAIVNGLVYHNGLIDTTTALIAAALVNTPTGVVAAVQSKSLGNPTQNEQPTPLSTQPAIGDWVKLSFSVRETDVNNGAFTYSYEVKDYGPTGLGTPVTLLTATYLSFTNVGLGGSATAGWTVGWASNVGGEHFDNFAAQSIPLTLTAAVSRKTHAGAGTFDLPLALTGPATTEPRSGGASSDFTIVFTFTNPISAADGVSTSCGTVSTQQVDPSDDHRYIVNMTGVVCNTHDIAITLTGVHDLFGDTLASATAALGLLRGDTNNDRIVNVGDALQTRSRSGQVTAASNFRSDVNTDGLVNSGDNLIVRANSGSAIGP